MANQVTQFRTSEQKMPSENGYVNLWRDINNQKWSKDALYYSVFTKLLTLVQHKPYTFTYKGVKVALQAGEFAIDYAEVANLFNDITDKAHARRIVKKFVSLGQLYTRELKDGKVNIGFVVGFSGWKKWQNWDTPQDTPRDTPKVTNIEAYRGGENTPQDTPRVTHINNNDLNNKKNNAGSEPQLDCSKLRKKAFEYFWKNWSQAKKLIGRTNTAPKDKTYSKNFVALYPDSYIKRVGKKAFAADVTKAVEFALMAHGDIAENQGFNQESDYSNHASMYPAKFLGNKQWREGDEQ